MTQFWYGGGPADWATSTVTVDGTDLVVQFKPGSTLTCWWEQIGGDQITELADETGNPIVEVTIPESGGEVYGPGTWPRFKAPVEAMWVSVDGGPRYYVVTTDMPAIAQAARDVATQAVQAAQIAASAAQEAAASSALPAHLEEPDPHEHYLNAARGDVRYPLRRPGLMPPLTEPIEVIRFSSTPAASDADLRQVYVTNGDVERLVAWLNERGYYRAEQVPGALWDAPYTSIVNHAGSGRAFLVQRRGVDNQRVDIGGFDAQGRPVTSDQTWTLITDVDPDETGDYEASSEVGPAPLAVRWDTDDVVRLQGRVTCANITTGDTILVIPDGYLPQSARLGCLPTTGGDVVPCELLVSGRLVARATVSGPCDLALDDVTYARVVAEQDTGDWDITYAGSATPGGTSPLTIAHAIQPGRLYVLAVGGSTSGHVVTGVTDDGSNDWNLETAAPPSAGTGRRIELWTLTPSNSATEVSIAFTGGATLYASLYEIQGHDAGDPVDAVASDVRSASTTPSPVTVTPSGPGRLVIYACQANNNTVAQMTPSAGWTMLGTNSGGPAVVYKVDAPVEAQGVSWTLTNSVGSGHAVIAINPD